MYKAICAGAEAEDGITVEKVITIRNTTTSQANICRG